MLTSLASLASLAGLDPVSAVALPTVVTVAARKVGMTEAALVREATVNAGLRAYLAGVCRSVDVAAVLQ
jgi:thiazole synthase ThiGH ThiG subunit